MNIKSFIRSLLMDPEIINLTANKKVHFVHAKHASPPYVEYQIYDEYGVGWAENEEISTNFELQVDIFSKGDYTELENKIKEKLISAGFVRDGAGDFYEEDTELYHKAMRFIYTKN